MHSHPTGERLPREGEVEGGGDEVGGVLKNLSMEPKSLQSEMTVGAIALLDVLGWKGIWQRNPNAIDELLAEVENMAGKAKAISTRETKVSLLEDRYKSIRPDVFSLSDTIAITVEGDVEPALEFIGQICGQLVNSTIFKGLPLRGAISYGPYLKRQNAMVGKAVDEVASWYEQADWIGVFVTPSAMLRFPSSPEYLPVICPRYAVPLKSAQRREFYCVDWTFWSIASPNTREKMEERRGKIVEALLELGPLIPEVANKVLNTLDFFDAMMERIPRNPPDSADPKAVA